MFIHFDMPRAAGDSMMDCIGRVYGYERILRIGLGIRYDVDIGTLMSMSNEAREELKRRHACFVTKHTFPLQRILHLPYAGFMRNPVDWYISSYFYARQTSLGDPSEPYGFAIGKYNFTLFEFVRWLMEIGHDNIQLKNITALQARITDGLPPRPACIAVNGDSASRAAEFIRQSFAVFAPTEKFAEGVYALGAIFNWPILPLWERKGSSGWRQNFLAPEGLVEYLREKNALDCDLFSQIDRDFDEKYNSLLAVSDKDIADYDACSRNPEYSDASAFHFFDLPAKLTAELQSEAECEGMDNHPLELGGMQATAKGDYLHGGENGHLIWSRNIALPPFVALPSEATYGLDRNVLPQSALFHPGALYAPAVSELRERLKAGEVPSLVETFGDSMIWFYRARYYLLDSRFYEKSIYDDPLHALGNSVEIGGVPEARQILQLLSDPFMLERLDGYAIREPDRINSLWKAIPRNPKASEYTANSQAGLIVAMLRDGALRFAIAPPMGIGALGLYNLAYYNMSYFAVLQGEGDLLDLLAEDNHGERLLAAPSLDALYRLVMQRQTQMRNAQPRFIEVKGSHNIVALGDVWLAVPQALGRLDLADKANHHLPGILKSRSQRRLNDMLVQSNG